MIEIKKTLTTQSKRARCGKISGRCFSIWAELVFTNSVSLIIQNNLSVYNTLNIQKKLKAKSICSRGRGE